MKFRNDPTSCNDLIITLALIALLVIAAFYWLYHRGEAALDSHHQLTNTISSLKHQSTQQQETIQSLNQTLQNKTKTHQATQLQHKQVQLEFDHNAQQLTANIQQLNAKNSELENTIIKLHGATDIAMVALSDSGINLKESYQLSEKEFNDYKMLRKEIVEYQFKAKNRLDEINNWQKEVIKLKSQLANTDVQISQLKSRFTVFEMNHEILFSKGQTQLKQAGRKVLSQLAEVFRQYPNRQIAIQGHSDNQNLGRTLKKRFNSNWELAAARAASAIYYLQNNERISPERMILVSYSQYRPKESARTQQDHAANRRIEIILMPKDFDFFRETTD